MKSDIDIVREHVKECGLPPTPSRLQRRFKWGYTRAANVLDALKVEMEEIGNGEKEKEMEMPTVEPKSWICTDCGSEAVGTEVGWICPKCTDRSSFMGRVLQAKERLTETDGLVLLESLDDLELSISDHEIKDNIAHIELEDMAEVCGERIWITVIR